MKYKVTKRGTEEWDYFYEIDAESEEEAKELVLRGGGKHVGEEYHRQAGGGITEIIEAEEVT